MHDDLLAPIEDALDSTLDKLDDVDGSLPEGPPVRPYTDALRQPIRSLFSIYRCTHARLVIQ